MGEGDQTNDRVEAPRGMFSGRLDEKGRLRVPKEFERYLRSLPEQKLFVTSLDRHTAQIYPIAVWRENEKFFENYTENPAAARLIAFNANDLGGDADIDANGRVLFPLELRRELGIENSNVKLFAYKGRIEVYSEAVYDEKKREASAAPANSLEILERAGLK